MFQESFRQKLLVERMDQSPDKKGDKKPNQDMAALLQSLQEANDQELEDLLKDPVLDRPENAAVRQQAIQLLAERRGADHVDQLLNQKQVQAPEKTKEAPPPPPEVAAPQAAAPEVKEAPAPAPAPEVKKAPEPAPVPVEVPVKGQPVKGSTPAEQAREAFKKLDSPLAEIIPEDLQSFVIDPNGRFNLRLPENEVLHLKEMDLFLEKEISGNLAPDRAASLKGISASAQLDKQLVKFRVEELIVHGNELLLKTDHPVMRLLRLGLHEFLVVLHA
jgi:hypothetical protein